MYSSKSHQRNILHHQILQVVYLKNAFSICYQYGKINFSSFHLCCCWQSGNQVSWHQCICCNQLGLPPTVVPHYIAWFSYSRLRKDFVPATSTNPGTNKCCEDPTDLIFHLPSWRVSISRKMKDTMVARWLFSTFINWPNASLSRTKRNN